MTWDWVKHAEFGYGQTIGDPTGDVATVAFPDIKAIPVRDLIFLPVVEVARLRKAGILPSGKSPWNGNCAPRQLGLRRSTWKHNPQVGPRGGVHLKTKFTPGGWPVGGKLRGGRQRFREDWNADNSGFAETHDRVNEGGAKYQLAEEKMPEAMPRPDQKPGVPLNFRTGKRADLTNAPEEKYQTHASEEISAYEPEPADDETPTNGNGRGKVYSTVVYSTVMRGLSSKSPLRLKLRGWKLDSKGMPVDDIADRLKVPRARIREWHRLGWFTKADREVLRKIGSWAKEEN